MSKGVVSVLVLTLLAGCAYVGAGVGGRSKLRVSEFAIPWADAFPSDLVVDRNGAVWFTDRVNSVIGRFDVASGAMRAFPTPTPKAAPYGIVLGSKGDIWYASSRAATIGRVNPATGEMAEYVISEGHGGPHGLIEAGGRVWFTMRQSDQYGWLDPATGQTQICRVPPPGSGPYSIAASPDGTVWMALQGSHQIGRIGSGGCELRLYALPPGARTPGRRSDGEIRRMAADSSGTLWYTDFRRHVVGRLDPATGEVKEFRPTRPDSHPYGIVSTERGGVWYNESKHNLMVHLDRRGREREVVRIPTAPAVVRHVTLDEKRGRVWMALSGSGRLGVIEQAR